MSSNHQGSPRPSAVGEVTSKGYTQIDLAIGVALMIFIVAIAFIYTSRNAIGPVNEAGSFQSRNEAESLLVSVFDQRGIPGDWHNIDDRLLVRKPSLGEYIYRTRVRVLETNSSDQSDKDVSVTVRPSEKAWNGTFTVYEGSTPLMADLESVVDSDDDGHPEEANITFRISVDAGSEKLVFVYYSNDTTIERSYDSLSVDESNLTVTALSEERLVGITPRKLDFLNNYTVSEFKERFALSRDFRLEVGSDWSYGLVIPEDEEVISSRRNYLFQNSTGHISSTQARVFVW